MFTFNSWIHAINVIFGVTNTINLPSTDVTKTDAYYFQFSLSNSTVTYEHVLPFVNIYCL